MLEFRMKALKIRISFFLIIASSFLFFGCSGFEDDFADYFTLKVAQLEKEGKLSLSDSLDKYVQDTKRIYINPDATIKELLSHRSGINDYT